ncbi:MAG TPA: ATP-binding protein [Thermoanaerobaculia bacterium]|nr:ATP-binding protein [Thermoanaerobaculia bacterium]
MSEDDSPSEDRRFLDAAPSPAAPRLETVLAGLGDAFLTLDREWRFTFVNQKAAEIAGRPVEQLLGQVCWDVFPAAVGSLLYDGLHRAMAEQRASHFEGYHARLNIWLENRAYPTPEGVSLFTTDITERKRAEEALQVLADVGPILTSSLDHEETLPRLVQRLVPQLADWCALDVVQEDGSLRRLAVARVDPELIQGERDLGFAIDQVVRTGEPVRIAKATETALRAAVGASDALRRLQILRLRSLLCVPLGSPDCVGGALTLATIRSARRYGPEQLRLAQGLAHGASLALASSRLYQQLLEEDRRKDDFLAMLAHELRNPLAPIVNATEMLRIRGDDPGVRHRAVEIVGRQSRHMARLLEDLLDVSRIRHGKIQLRREPVEVRDLVRRVVDAARTLGGHEIETVLPADPIWLNADPARLEQVLANLLHNAVKFTPAPGRIVVRVELRDAEVVLRVRDEGAGIPPDLAARIFDPFVQEDRSLARSQGGLGIGLTLVRSLVGLHGGEVEAHSEGPGHGSELVVRLPWQPGVRPADGLAAPPPGEPERRRKVLVVEDNPDAAEALAEILRLWGYESHVAGDGPAGLELALQVRPRILLLDIGLPGMDGYELARRLRCLPGLQNARYIALTGYGQESDRQRSREAGFDYHLTKPVAPQTLREVLEQRA